MTEEKKQEKTRFEEFRLEGGEILNMVKEIIHEGPQNLGSPPEAPRPPKPNPVFPYLLKPAISTPAVKATLGRSG